MTKLFIEDSSLTAIGDAIRAKTGGTELLSPSGMATAIEGIETGGGGGEEIPEEAFVFSGNMDSIFANNKWGWFINQYGNKITTQNITRADSVFLSSNAIESLPFDFNFDNSTAVVATNMFYGCENLREVGVINNLKPSSLQNFFQSCYRLRELPEFINLDLSTIYSTTTKPLLNNMFANCYSLRSIPASLMAELKTPAVTKYYGASISAFNYLYAIDELVGIHPYICNSPTVNITTNMFSLMLQGFYRVKNLTFAVQDDGSPYVMNWSNQTIDLSLCIGRAAIERAILDYNSGITADKQVKDDATYAALKNDPDWFTIKTEYSRYNHDSAVNTINSLPDVSQGTGNTIKFEGAAGSKTDGGAINTLTEEEIAVAAAKGWTVTLS